MKLLGFNKLINIAFNYVILTSKKMYIDESHALKHSMDVFNFATQIYNSEIKNNPSLIYQKEIISISAILHDMCDKKYMDEKEGLYNINNYLSNYISNSEINSISNIISTMSYSKVKQHGYPELGDIQMAYHIVREADLLAGYDVNRCIIYGIMRENLEYTDSVIRASQLFDERMFNYRSDNLFITEFSINKSIYLENESKQQLDNLISSINF